jgi:hypothetical protein
MTTPGRFPLFSVSPCTAREALRGAACPRLLTLTASASFGPGGELLPRLPARSALSHPRAQFPAVPFSHAPTIGSHLWTL